MTAAPLGSRGGRGIVADAQIRPPHSAVTGPDKVGVRRPAKFCRSASACRALPGSPRPVATLHRQPTRASNARREQLAAKLAASISSAPTRHGPRRDRDSAGQRHRKGDANTRGSSPGVRVVRQIGCQIGCQPGPHSRPLRDRQPRDPAGQRPSTTPPPLTEWRHHAQEATPAKDSDSGPVRHETAGQTGWAIRDSNP
jgi:hypothetical protein